MIDKAWRWGILETGGDMISSDEVRALGRLQDQLMLGKF